ncbi:MAG: helicase-associated domain-containing protein [Armatimonadetes bacterium]|nr:helicase-associated domain-containing protein [Armatimonadota bacterium]
MVSLRERLAGRDAAQRAAAAGHWGVCADGLADAPDADALAALMAAETPVRTAFDRLSAPEKDVLRAMASAAHRGWVAVADVRRLTGIPDSKVADLLRDLEAKAVAFVEERDLPADNPYWGPTWAGRRLPTRPTPVVALAEEVASLFLDAIGEYAGGAWYAEVPSPLSRLEALPALVLHAMAGHYGVSLDGVETCPGKLASRLQAAMKEQGAIWQVIRALPPDLRVVLDAVESAGGRLPIEDVCRHFDLDYPALHAVLGALAERGLAFDRFAHRTRVLLVPERVLEAMARHTLPAMPRARLRPVAAPGSECRLQLDLLWSLLQLVRHVRLEGLARAATTNAVPKRTAARLMAFLRHPPSDRSESEWIEQMIRYLAAVGVFPNPGNLRLAAAPEWLRQDAFTQARGLLERWLEGYIEDLRQPRCELGLWMDYAGLAAGRGLLADLLRRCRPGQWYAIQSLLKAAAGVRPFFLRDRERVVRQQGYRGLKRMLASWFEVEGRALALHLTGLPFELGMVALDHPLAGCAAPPRGAAFRLTEWGAALLGMVAPPPAPNGGRVLVVQPNFDVVAMEFAPGVLDVLGQFAAPVAYDQVATYRIDRRSTNLALADGWTGERVLEFLNAHARAPLPQNVEQSVRDWARAIRHARFVRALVVESEDPGVLEELAASRALQGHVRGLARGTVLILDPDADLRLVARELRPEGLVLESEEE